MAVNPGTSLSLGIGLTGKPESMARFVQLRAQGQAAAKKAKKDDIDAKNEAIRKQLMSVGGGARLPVFEELYVNRKADVVRRLTEMAGSPDLNAATDMINGLAQDAKRWEEQTKLFYADKNDANSYSRRVLQTEKDPLKIAQALNNDAGTLKFDANNPNLLIDDFTYVKPNEYIQKVFSDNNLFQPPTEGNLQRINNQVYSNQVIPEPTINSIIANSFADKNFNRSMESMFQEQLRAQGKPIDRQDPQYQKDYATFFDNSMRNYGKSLKKSTEVTEAKGMTINNYTGAGSEGSVGGITTASLSYKNKDIYGNMVQKTTKEYPAFTFTKTKSQLGSNTKILNYDGNEKADLNGVSTFEFGQAVVMPLYKKGVTVKTEDGKTESLEGRLVDAEVVDRQESLGNVEYKVVATGVGSVSPTTVNKSAKNASEIATMFSTGGLDDKFKYIEIVRPLNDVQGAVLTGFSKDEKFAFEKNVNKLNEDARRLQREADAKIKKETKAPAATPKEKSGTKNIEERKNNAARLKD
jgi:hypothetical protein